MSKKQERRLRKLRKQLLADIAKMLNNSERLRKLRGVSDEVWQEAIAQDTRESVSAT